MMNSIVHVLREALGLPAGMRRLTGVEGLTRQLRALVAVGGAVG